MTEKHEHEWRRDKKQDKSDDVNLFCNCGTTARQDNDTGRIYDVQEPFND